MQNSHENFYLRAAWAWILAGTIFRIFYAGTFLLAPDETNYWQWSRHLALGYHDQAPLLAWAIRLSTLLFGHTEIGVRLPSVLAMGAASAYLLVLAHRWFGSRPALHVALATQSVLLFNVGGLLATPDGLQALAWAGAGYHVARAYENDRMGQWLLGGLWFGIGLLSKYTMVIFLPGVYLYGLFSKSHRARLMTLKPYTGVLLGLMMFTPVMIWNAQNNWNSFRHVAYIGGANETFSLHLKYFGDLLASQAALLSPLVFILVLLSWARVILKKFPQGRWIYPYLLFSSAPLFAMFSILSLHTRVYGNWPGAGYLTATVLMAAFFSERRPNIPDSSKTPMGSKIWPWALGTSYLYSALVLIQVAWPVLPIPARLDRTATEISGWKDLGQKADELRKLMPDPEKTFLFGIRYQVASELAFYVPGQPDTVSINRWKRPNVYDYWWKDEDLLGWDAVGVTLEPESHQTRLNQIFERVLPPVKLEVYRKHGWLKSPLFTAPVKEFYLYRAFGFKGGLRWLPPDAADIRAK
ncbi:MAG: glycosyltransferase family 39 protein [Desulfobacterales bacterium]|nr:glycosyltransferase family 39 protein [Desulfobacterales bacterium]